MTTQKRMPGGPDTLTFVGPGLVLGGPQFTAVLAEVQRACDVWGRRLGASRVHATGTLTAQTLRDAGYFTNFPQHVFTKAPFLQEIEQPPADYTTSPAACLCLYEAYRGRELTEATTLDLVAALGRYEAGSHADPFRLAAYHGYESVRLGTRAEAVAFFQAARDLIEELSQVFPQTRVEIAHDAFFGPTARVQQSYQERVKVKYELQAEVEGHGWVSIASVNFHGQAFGNGFGIVRGGEAAFSACFGVGLERFALYAIDVLGPDVEAWPAATRARQADPAEV
ncbi:hypothetical protein [Cellulomonas sp. URHD0024]|uniref:hypothetical protein n=1 Tax=Cellulomonas sp. URHD0024 TaxID=1302620 RepID=UPI0004221421|nr:hypothetical protein [Cellulomonas sp. URHD0024]